MPRVGGVGGRGFGGRTSRSASHSYSPAPVPQPVHQTPPPELYGSSYGGYRFGSYATMLAGVMIWCAGAVFAMRAVDSFWGPRTINVQTVGSEKAKSSSMFSSMSKGDDACGMQLKAFQDCLKSCDGEFSKCQFYTDMLAECKKNSG